MDSIKRKKERGDNILSYKFGIHKKFFSRKIILTSMINKRIILDKYTLHKCLKFRYPIEIIKFLIRKDILDIFDEDKYTPLQYALHTKYPEEIIRLLITEKNVDMKDKHLENSLQIALQNGYSKDIIRLLISKESVESYNYCGHCALHFAMRSNQSEEILELLKND